MRDLNLLPQEYRRKPFTLKMLLTILLSAAIIVLFVQYAYLDPVLKEKVSYRQLMELLKKTEAMPVIEEEYALQQSLLEDVKHRATIMQEMEESTPLYWHRMLGSLNECLPQGAFLNQFTCDQQTLLLSGICLNDMISTQYLRNLEETGYFHQVRMEKIVYQQDNRVIYTIRCSLIRETEGNAP